VAGAIGHWRHWTLRPGLEEECLQDWIEDLKHKQIDAISQARSALEIIKQETLCAVENNRDGIISYVQIFNRVIA
jgi:hypothetical protein